METMENNLPSATHQEKAKKMKKLRRWQIAISLLGVVPSTFIPPIVGRNALRPVPHGIASLRHVRRDHELR